MNEAAWLKDKLIQACKRGKECCNQKKQAIVSSWVSMKPHERWSLTLNACTLVAAVIVAWIYAGQWQTMTDDLEETKRFNRITAQPLVVAESASIDIREPHERQYQPAVSIELRNYGAMPTVDNIMLTDSIVIGHGAESSEQQKCGTTYRVPIARTLTNAEKPYIARFDLTAFVIEQGAGLTIEADGHVWIMIYGAIASRDRYGVWQDPAPFCFRFDKYVSGPGRMCAPLEWNVVGSECRFPQTSKDWAPYFQSAIADHEALEKLRDKQNQREDSRPALPPTPWGIR